MLSVLGVAITIRRAAWVVYEEPSGQRITRNGQEYAFGTSPAYSYYLENESTGVGLFDLSGGSTDQCCNAHSDYEKDNA